MPRAEKTVTKIYFSLSEVSSILGETTTIVRKWADYFPGVTPKTKSHERRSFNRKDIAILKKAKKLVRHRKFLLEGARLELEKQFRPRKRKQIINRHAAVKLVDQPHQMIVELSRPD